MRVLLVSASVEQVNMPVLPLGLGVVGAAVRRAGHEVAFVGLAFEPDRDRAIRRVIEEFHPGAIGISVRNVDDQNMQQPCFFLDAIRDLVAACHACCNAPVVLGGAGYSIYPGPALAYLGADAGVCGEGEFAFPAVLARLERGDNLRGLAGVYTLFGGFAADRSFTLDLDAVPFPDEAVWAGVDPATPDLWLPVQSRRGCPLDCSYCSTASIEGRATRMRPPRAVAEEIRRAAHAGFRRFYFVDNTFNIPRSYALELCSAIKQLDVPVAWRCIFYPHETPEELIQAMAEAGCVEASLGFESGSEKMLRAMGKRFSPDEVRCVSDMLRSHAVRRDGFLLLGGPGETKESVEESLAFADSLELDLLNVKVGIRIYPGTPLCRIAVEEGMIAPDDDLLRPRFYLARGLEDYPQEVAARQGQSR